jgi:hypothetical protein
VATHSEHREKAEHNEFLVSTLDNPFWDWKISAMFYSALHYVESYFAVKKIVHPIPKPNHSSRLPLVKKHLFTIYKDYQDLYNDSRDARYEADMMFSQREVRQDQEKLDAIKAVILPVVKPAE